MVYGITTLLQKKLDRSTQFGAVGYIITLYSSKSYVKVGFLSKFWGGSDPPPPVVAPMSFNMSFGLCGLVFSQIQ